MIDKHAIAQAFRAKINASAQIIEDSLHQLEHSLFEETKSSAGDKYETSREMIQSEMDRLEKQKQQIIQDMLHFQFIETPSTIERGSLVEIMIDKQRHFLYIAAAVGNIAVEGVEIRSISVNAPLGSILIGKSSGDLFKWNQKSIQILNCY